VAHAKSGRCSDLNPVERGYSIGLNAMREHSQLFGHILPFVVPTIITINPKNGVRSL